MVTLLFTENIFQGKYNIRQLKRKEKLVTKFNKNIWAFYEIPLRYYELHTMKCVWPGGRVPPPRDFPGCKRGQGLV